MSNKIKFPERDSEEITALTRSVEEFCTRALTLQRLREVSPSTCSYDRHKWQEMVELGWSAIALTESQGGYSLGTHAITTVAENLGKVAAAEPFIESAVVATTLLAALENAPVELESVLSGENIVALPLTHAGWQAASHINLTTSANGFVLDGITQSIPNGADADIILLPLQQDNRLSMVVLPTDTSGLSIRKITLVDKSSDAVVTLDNVSCSKEQLIPNTASLSQAINNAIDLGALAAAAYLTGLSKALYELTLEHVKTRHQFGQPIGAFQVLQHRLVDLLLAIRLADAAINRSADDRNQHQKAAISALSAKHRAIQTSMHIAREAIQLHGAMGVTAECDVSLFVQRILVTCARFGNSIEALRANTLARFEHHALQDDVPSTHSSAPATNDWNSIPDDHFRQLFRQWVAENYNDAHRHAPAYLRWEENRAWHEKLLAKGWAAPAWPVEHGGMGLSPNKMLIYIEELERHGVSRGPDQGIVMLGPILLEHGNEQQRERFLKPALHGEHIWCQGYSEPNAGSDLASLKTHAVLQGDEFIVNGQKTWTTHALDATHMYCLVRTDNDAKPQRGISFLLIDLNQPGVTIRPIPNLSGHVDFCEVFLDDVRVPVENLVGEINQGWTIAKALLGHERLFVGSPSLCQHALNQLQELALANGLVNDPVFIDKLTQISLDVSDLEALYAEFALLIKDGKPLGADVALLKIGSTETYTRLSEMIFEAASESAAHQGTQQLGDLNIDVLSHYYAARPAPIYAGSNEIQRNIIAKHLLGLPS